MVSRRSKVVTRYFLIAKAENYDDLLELKHGYEFAFPAILYKNDPFPQYFKESCQFDGSFCWKQISEEEYEKLFKGE